MYAWACRQLRKHIEGLLAYDPSLVMFHRYDDTGDAATQERLTGFLRANMSKLLKGKFRKTNKRKNHEEQVRTLGLFRHPAWPLLNRCVNKVQTCTTRGTDENLNSSCVDGRVWGAVDPVASCLDGAISVSSSLNLSTLRQMGAWWAAEDTLGDARNGQAAHILLGCERSALVGNR